MTLCVIRRADLLTCGDQLRHDENADVLAAFAGARPEDTTSTSHEL